MVDLGRTILTKVTGAGPIPPEEGRDEEEGGQEEAACEDEELEGEEGVGESCGGCSRDEHRCEGRPPLQGDQSERIRERERSKTQSLMIHGVERGRSVASISREERAAKTAASEPGRWEGGRTSVGAHNTTTQRIGS